MSNNFWEFIENKMGCTVPKHIQNIFALNGYENAVSIKTLTPADVNSLEKFAQEKMASRLPSIFVPSDYYGCFSDPKEFVFLPVYVKLIEEIVIFIREKTALHGPDYFTIKTKQTVPRMPRVPSEGKL